jgi:hypothetical protein
MKEHRHVSRRRQAAFALILLVWLTMPGEVLAMVRLSSAEQSHLGVRTLRLAGVNRSGEIDGFAKVLDPGPLAQLVSDLQTAQASYAASGAEAARAKSLHAQDLGVSAKDTEAAVAQATSDGLRVTQLRRRLGLEWGPGIARLSDAERTRLVEDLAKGRTALVHVDSHNNAGQAGARRVRIDIGTDSVAGAVIGPARAAEPRLQSSGVIVKVTGPSAILLSTGLTQTAHIATQDPRTGVIVPRAAIIRYQGSDWVYVHAGPDRFERRLIVDPVPEDRGFFVSRGLEAGDEVIVDGVSAVFAMEQARAR